MDIAIAKMYVDFVSENIKNDEASSRNEIIRGIRYPLLSVNLPDGKRNMVFVTPLIPKRIAINDDERIRFSEAWIAKNVMRIAFVNAKVDRRYDIIKIFLDETIFFKD